MSSPAFVGRQWELSALGRSLATPPAVVLVEGEAGIGKSRLLREFAASSGKLPVVAACPPFREPHTLGPVVDAVRQVTDQVSGMGLSDLAGSLRPLFPEWAPDLPAAPDPAEDAQAARHRLFRAVIELLSCLDVSTLVVEDVHWADEATLEFLLFALSCQPPPFSLVATYRPEDVPTGSLLLRLSSRPPAGITRTRLSLGPLDVEETSQLVSSMLGSERLSVEFATFVHERTDGLPLAVEESVRLMHDRADVTRRGDGWVRRHLEEIEVPPTVRDAVLERCGRLSGEALAMLRAAAVLTGTGRQTTLTAVSGLDAADAADGLAEALDSGLLEEDERGQVSFRHGLAARAVYEATPGPQRRATHLRAGRVLEEMSPQPVARLSRHFREAGEIGAWARYAEQAADVSTAAGDLVAAAALLHDLLSSGELPAEAVAPLAAKIPHGPVAGVTRLQDVVRALRAALESGTLDVRQEAATRVQLGIMLESMSDYNASSRELELAVPGLEPGSRELFQALVLLGWPRGSDCPGSVHRDWLRRAAEVARLAPPAYQPEFAHMRAIGLLLLGDPEGWEVAATLSDEVSTPAQRRYVTHCGLNLGGVATYWGRYPQARRWLGNALDLAESHGYPRYRDLILGNLILLDWFTGDWSGLAERAADLAATEDTLPTNRAQAELVAGLLLAAHGQPEEAETVLRRVLTELCDLGVTEVMVESAAALAELHLAAGRTDEALLVTSEPVSVVALKETWLWATDLAPARVEALVAKGRIGEASELVGAFADGLRGLDAPAAQAALRLCQGIVTIAQDQGGGRERAAETFARTAEAMAELPRPYDALLARERAADCLLAEGLRETALPLLGEVHTGLSELGATAAAERVLAKLKESGADAAGPRRRGRPGYGDRLSPRELEVVCLVVDGRTNRQIAEALVVSHQTVNSHVSSAMRKLRVSSRTALAVSAVELDLVGHDRAAQLDD